MVKFTIFNLKSPIFKTFQVDFKTYTFPIIHSGKQSYSICNLAICNTLFSIFGAVRGLGIMSPLLILGKCRSCEKEIQEETNFQAFQWFST